MKLFLKKIGLFVVPLILFFVVLEINLRKIPNDFKYKSNYLKKNSKSIEVLILGSSHSFSFVRPDLFESSTFNSANLHQTLRFDAFIFNRFVDEMPKLKVVILPVSYGIYHAALDKSKDQWRIKDYCLYYDYPSSSPKNHLEIINGDTKTQFTEVCEYICDRKNKITCDSLGYGIRFAEDDQVDMESAGRTIARRQTEDCEEDNIEDNLISIESILEKCQEKGIRVVLYTAPAYESYYSELDSGIYNKTLSINQKLKDKYSVVEYKNYLSDNRFEVHDFRDPDHLNLNGAQKFTTILRTDFQLD